MSTPAGKDRDRRRAIINKRHDDEVATAKTDYFTAKKLARSIFDEVTAPARAAHTVSQEFALRTYHFKSQFAREIRLEQLAIIDREDTPA